MNLSKQLIGLLGWLGITFVAAALGAWASITAGSFYAQLARPEWAPPAAWFSPVWTSLYLMMAIAAWLVWRERGFQEARGALILYLAQLAANTLWSWLFFGWRLGGPAFADIIVLWILIALTLRAFWRVHKLAGLLLVPYLLWVSFAMALNYSIWQRNPQLLG
ncbi:MAG: TspO/MBR family protein [Burkholderiaceae bacterium]